MDYSHNKRSLNYCAMILKSLAFILLAAFVAAKNPTIISPKSMTYTAGDVMEIQWANADTGHVNIDLVDSGSNVLTFPMAIADGVPAQAGKYSWTIPAGLKTASNYQLRVWGSHQPTSTDDGMSPKFTILNILPHAINTFTVISPNRKSPCVIGKTCKITWDFPKNGIYPAMVDIALYRVGDPNPISHIATVSSSMKSFDWAVPNDTTLMSNDVYISVSGQGAPMAGPGMSNDMGGNSQGFHVDAPDSNTSTKDIPKKATPKKPLPRVNPKVSGASSKDNSATEVTTSAGVLSLVLVMTLLTMYL